MTPSTESQSVLSIAGQAALSPVPGLVLEAQYRLADGRFLLISTDNCPFEECLHLLLLDQDYTLQERVDVGSRFTSGLFRHPRVIHPGCLEFTFYDQTRFRAIIQEQPTRALGRLFSNNGITYSTPLAKKSLMVVLAS